MPSDYVLRASEVKGLFSPPTFTRGVKDLIGHILILGYPLNFLHVSTLKR